MEQTQLLYELQTLDQRIAAGAAQLAAERARIQEPAAVRQARQDLARGELRLGQLRHETRATEQEVDAVTAKKTTVHQKLYGGNVTVPRELAALETEEAALAKTLSQLEDRELELMAAAEETEGAVGAAQSALEAALAAWQQSEHEAHAHIDELQAEGARLAAERAELAGRVSPSNLALYERLRPRKGNQPVALVRDNSCQACRVTLPMREVQRARTADPPMLCDNCGRILYVR